MPCLGARYVSRLEPKHGLPTHGRTGGTLRLLKNDQLGGSYDDDCPGLRETLNRVGDKWSVLVVVLLGSGATRFNKLRRAIDGISQRVLTATLRRLERDGLVERTVYPTNPPQVAYALTSLGRSFLGPIKALATWADQHRAEVDRARAKYEDADREGPASSPERR